MSTTIETFRANLAKAIRDRTPLTVGGGEFRGSELVMILNALQPKLAQDWILKNATYSIDEHQNPVLTLPMFAPIDPRGLLLAIYEELKK